MRNIAIRKATLEDAKVAGHIRKEAILNQCITCYSQEAMDIWTSGNSSEVYLDDTENLYVALEKNEVVGTGIIDLKTGKIGAVFVRPSYMRQGIGASLVNFLEQLAKKNGIDKITLKSTLNAASFYRHCGYEGDEISEYHSPRGIVIKCVPMTKNI